MNDEIINNELKVILFSSDDARCRSYAYTY